MSGIATIVLAAGAATRMGRPKQLLEIGGTSLVRRAAEAALQLDLGPVVLVLGAHGDLIAPEVGDLPLQRVQHSEWHLGMGSSIRAGMEALDLDSALEGVLLSLADQPGVDGGVLGRIVTAFRQGEVEAVASGYDGIVGAPALFGPAWYSRLRALDGDYGAGRLLRSDLATVRVVSLSEASLDVDTPDDFDRARRDLDGRALLAPGGRGS